MTGLRAENAQTIASIEHRMSEMRRALYPSAIDFDALPGYETLMRLQSLEIIDPDERRIPVTYGVSSKLDDAGCLGVTTLDRSGRFVIVLSDATERDLVDDKPEAKEVLAHELGHLALHPVEIIRASTVPGLMKRLSTDHQLREDLEWQADIAASALLAPRAGVRELLLQVGIFVPEAVADRFGTTITTAHARCELLQMTRREPASTSTKICSWRIHSKA